MSSISNLKILCVEDDKFSREEMAHFLKKRAGKVFTAVDGKDGIESFDIHKPDIVIVDLLMPEMDGMEMIRRLKSRYDNVHCIIVTSVNKTESVIEAVDLGIDGYIVKPVDFAELELKLSKVGDALVKGDEKAAGIFDHIENKGIIEDSIKRDAVKILKDFTGKGPRETVVQLIGEESKITMFGGLTKMETSLLRKAKNFEMVKHVRLVAYEQMKVDFETIAEKHTGMKASVFDVKVDLRKGMEQIIIKHDII